MIKLVATDVDGTLVVDGSASLNPDYFPVFERLMEKGILVVVASGRGESSIENIMKPIADQITMIAEGGAYVCAKGKPLEVHKIPLEMVREIVIDIREMTDCEIMVNGPNTCYVETKDDEFLRWIIEDYHFNVTKVEDLLEVEDEIVKISLYHPIDAGKQAENGFLQKWKDQLHLAVSGNEWVDCVMPGINKGTALQKIQEQYGISKEETMVFGDNKNDLEMLEQAYYSFAVENAREEVREKARYIADSNVNHGVLKVLRQLL